MGCCHSQTERVFDYLRHSIFSLYIDSEDLHKLASIFTIHEYNRRDIIVEAKHASVQQEFYVVAEGEIVLHIGTASDQEVPLTKSIKNNFNFNVRSISSNRQDVLQNSFIPPKRQISMGVLPEHMPVKRSTTIAAKRPAPLDLVSRRRTAGTSTEHGISHHAMIRLSSIGTDDEPMTGARLGVRKLPHASFDTGPLPTRTLGQRQRRTDDDGEIKRQQTMLSAGTNETNDYVFTVKKTGDMFAATDIIKEAAALTKCVVLSVSKETLRKSLSKDKKLQKRFLKATGYNIHDFVDKVALFRGLPQKSLHLVSSMLHYWVLDKDDVLYSEGQEGDSMFFVVQGQVIAVSEDDEGDETVLSTFRRGDLFGAISMYLGVPRKSTAKATRKSFVCELLSSDFQSLLFMDPSSKLYNNLRALLKQLTVGHFKRFKVPFWASIPEHMLQVLAELGEIHRFEAEDMLFTEKEAATHFYLIFHGKVWISYKTIIEGENVDLKIDERGPGHFLGEVILAREKVHKTTAKAITDCVVIAIAQSGLDEFFRQCPEAQAACEVEVSKRDISLVAVLHHSLPFKYFKKHLQMEYSTENMDFWMEARQFRERYRGEDEDSPPSSVQSMSRRLSPQTPVSPRTSAPKGVFFPEVQHVDPMVIAAKRLYELYIKDGAAKQINIQFNTAEEIELAIHRPETIHSFTFEKARLEIFRLMERDSLPRFKQSELFEQFLQETEEEKAKTRSYFERAMVNLPTQTKECGGMRKLSESKSVQSLTNLERRSLIKTMYKKKTVGHSSRAQPRVGSGSHSDVKTPQSESSAGGHHTRRQPRAKTQFMPSSDHGTDTS